MKKNFLTICALASTFLLNSCGIGTTGLASQTPATPATPQQQASQAGANIGAILGSITGIGDILSNALGITTTNIVGTWIYQEPAVLFESDNILTKAGGKLAAQSMAKKIDTYFQKAGIVKGKFSMTFDKSGNFTQSISGRTQSGTYTLDNGTVNLTYQAGVQQIVGTTQFDGNNLVIVVDMTKLLNLAKTVSAASNNQTLNGISTLASGVSGMKAGLKFVKQ